LVERPLWEREVAGSNPVAPTSRQRLDTNFHTTGDLPHADHFG
jgi:hypothetical protein